MRKILPLLVILLFFIMSCSNGKLETQIASLQNNMNEQYETINSQFETANSKFDNLNSQILSLIEENKKSIEEERQAREEMFYKLDFLAIEVSKVKERVDKIGIGIVALANYSPRNEYSYKAIPAVYSTPRTNHSNSYRYTSSYIYPSKRKKAENLANIVGDVALGFVTEPIKIIDDIQNKRYGSAVVRILLVGAASKVIGKVAKHGKRIFQAIFK